MARSRDGLYISKQHETDYIMTSTVSATFSKVGHVRVTVTWRPATSWAFGTLCRCSVFLSGKHRQTTQWL